MFVHALLFVPSSLPSLSPHVAASQGEVRTGYRRTLVRLLLSGCLMQSSPLFDFSTLLWTASRSLCARCFLVASCSPLLMVRLIA